MAHDRKRQVEELYRKQLGFSPIVGVFGHRQVGKSTFIAGNVNEYSTLDDDKQLQHAHQDPKNFIKDRKLPFAIDECQHEAKLFPALKEWVRIHKKPGQFVLSGSVRFTSRKSIRESLAGRMAFFEMLPLTISEIRSEPLPDILPKLLSHQIFSFDSLSVLRSKRDSSSVKKDFEIYLKNGGLPGLCFMREAHYRADSLRFLHDLIIDRDLRMVHPTKLPTASIRRLLEWIALHSWERYNLAEVRRSLKLAEQTQKSLLYAMESVFLIRRIPGHGKKGETFLLEDQFEELVLSQGKMNLNKKIEGALYRNLRSQFMYRLGYGVTFETYLTRDGARVPLVIRTATESLGIISIEKQEPSLSERRSAASFLSKVASSKIIYVTRELVEAKVMNERCLLTSLYSIL